MKKMTALLLSFFILYCCTAQNADYYFKQLSTLIGTWQMETGKGIVFENWVLSSDSCLHGMSFRLNHTDTILIEEVNLINRSGVLYYIPIVREQNNQQPVIFKLVKITNETFVFENPEHDFPQRIIYQLPKNDLLYAWIEGTMNGQFRKSEFRYKKTNR